MRSPLSEQYVSYVLDRARASCRRGGYSDSTKKRYLHWIRRFMEVCKISGPQDLHPGTARAFLKTLSGYAPPTQKQARNALHLLFDTVLKSPLDDRVRLSKQMEQEPSSDCSQTDTGFGGDPMGADSTRLPHVPQGGIRR